MSNRSVFNYYSQKYFKENPDRIPEKSKKRNFATNVQQNPEEGLEFTLPEYDAGLSSGSIEIDLTNHMGKGSGNPKDIAKGPELIEALESQQVIASLTKVVGSFISAFNNLAGRINNGAEIISYFSPRDPQFTTWTKTIQHPWFATLLTSDNTKQTINRKFLGALGRTFNDGIEALGISLGLGVINSVSCGSSSLDKEFARLMRDAYWLTLYANRKHDTTLSSDKPEHVERYVINRSVTEIGFKRGALNFMNKIKALCGISNYDVAKLFEPVMYTYKAFSRKSLSSKKKNFSSQEKLTIYLKQALKGKDPADIDDNSFWGKVQRFVGSFNDRMDSLIENDLKLNKEWIAETASSLDENFKGTEEEKAQKLKIIALEKAKDLTGKNEYDRILAKIRPQSGKQKAFSRRSARNFADNDVIKTAVEAIVGHQISAKELNSVKSMAHCVACGPSADPAKRAAKLLVSGDIKKLNNDSSKKSRQELQKRLEKALTNMSEDIEQSVRKSDEQADVKSFSRRNGGGQNGKVNFGLFDFFSYEGSAKKTIDKGILHSVWTFGTHDVRALDWDEKIFWEHLRKYLTNKNYNAYSDVQKSLAPITSYVAGKCKFKKPFAVVLAFVGACLNAGYIKDVSVVIDFHMTGHVDVEQSRANCEVLAKTKEFQNGVNNFLKSFANNMSWIAKKLSSAKNEECYAFE